MIKIDKDIPLSKFGTRMKYPFRKMEKGDSFFIKTEDDACDKGRITTRLHNCARSLNIPGYKITTRREENGVRCWRVQ